MSRILLTDKLMKELEDLLSSISAMNRVYTIKKVITFPGRTDQNYFFKSAANQNEQVITMSGIIPPYARILDAFLYSPEQWTSGVSFGVKLGNASSGEQFIASANMYATGAKASMAHAGGFNNAITDVASDICVSCTPGANWSALTGGKLVVYVTYIDLYNIQ
jgi:hypothetical protein